MIHPRYRKSNSLATYNIGYYVFTLPNGQLLDMFAGERMVIPEGIDLSKLPMQYVERTVTGPDILDALLVNREVMLKEPEQISTTDELESALAGAAGLREDLERYIDRELTMTETAVAAVAG